MRHALGLVVPVFDEAHRFGEFANVLVEYVRGLPEGSELVFVDDGSRDGTAELAEQLTSGEPRARVLRRPHEGKGAAVAAGLRSISAPYAAFCDIDLSTPLDQLELVVSAAERAPVLAIASRDLATSRLVRAESPVREALGRTYNRLLQATVTPGVVDTQCGAKAASRVVWHRVLTHTAERGFAWDAEAVAVALALGIPVQEVPIEWHHDERSGINVARDGLAMVRATPRIWWRARRAARDRVGDATIAERHWWFRSKAALVATAIRRTGGGGGTLVDVGGGDGAVTARLGWDPGSIVVIELDAAAALVARERRGLRAVQGLASAQPVRGASVSVVCALDVIEHLVGPGEAVCEAARVLESGGRLVLTVPALPWLWSDVDRRLGHVRRYTANAVESLVRDAGLEPLVLTYVFSWLVGPMLVGRRMLGQSGVGASWPVVDRLALVLTALERALVGRVRLPVGTTVLCVARKPL